MMKTELRAGRMYKTFGGIWLTFTGQYFNVDGVIRAEMERDGSKLYVDLDFIDEEVQSTQTTNQPTSEAIPTMKNSAILVNALHKNLKCVQVRFKRGNSQGESKEYAYKTFLEFEIGDEAIVDSPVDGLTTVVVVGLDPTPLGEHRLKWIVQAIDDTEYRQTVQLETLAVANISALMAEHKRTEALAMIKEAIGMDGVADDAVIKLLTEEGLDDDDEELDE